MIHLLKKQLRKISGNTDTSSKSEDKLWMMILPRTHRWWQLRQYLANGKSSRAGLRQLAWKIDPLNSQLLTLADQYQMSSFDQILKFSTIKKPSIEVERKGGGEKKLNEGKDPSRQVKLPSIN